MPKKVTPRQITKYRALRRAGHTQVESARRADISRSTAYKLDNLGRTPTGQVATSLTTLVDEEQREEAERPKARDELAAVAADCLEDFGRFRARYLGSMSYPWQEEAAHTVIQHLESPEDSFGVINCPQGSGKALAVDTPIPTPTGWTTMGALRVGDLVFGSGGAATRVTYKSPVFVGHDCYRVQTDDGASVVADADHLWAVTIVGEAGAGDKVLTTAELTEPRFAKPQIIRTGPVEYPRAELPVDPWVLGAWLGDGDSKAGGITAHEDDQPYMRGEFEAAGYATYPLPDPQRFMVVDPAGKWGRNGLTSHLRQAGVLRNKHIPPTYLTASIAQRRALLQGLVDTDGSVDSHGGVEFTNKNKNIAEGVASLARSLGAKASIRPRVVNGTTYYRVCFRLLWAARMPRKAERCRALCRNRYLTVTAVESVPTQCITVDSPDSLYLAGEGYLVTHNTRLFSHDIPAWITARDRSIRGILGSAGLGVSQSMSGNLRDSLERTSPVRARDVMVRRGLARNADATLAQDYGRFKPSGAGNLWRRDAFTVEQVDGAATQDKESTWAAFSYEAKFLSWRVDFMNWDDVHTQRQLLNPDGMEALFRWWDAEAESRLDPGGLCLVTMQRLGANDISRYLLDKADPEFEIDADQPDKTPKQYFHVVYRAHYDDRCHDQHGRTAASYPEGCMLQPDRITWAKIKQKKIAGNYEVVYQQEDTDPASVLVQRPWVNGGVDAEGVEREGCWDKDRVLGQLPPIPSGSYAVRYMTVDPSPTKWWGIHDWVYVLPPNIERTAGYRYLVNTVRAKLGANEFLDFDHSQQGYAGVAEEWVQDAKHSGLPISYLIMEKNAAQRWAMQYDFFVRWAQTRSVNVLAHETTNNKTDPELGVWATLPSVYRFGRVRLPGGDTASRTAAYHLVQEVTTYPNGTTDDQLMSQWFGEYNLHQLVAARSQGNKVHTGMPSWMRER